MRDQVKAVEEFHNVYRVGIAEEPCLLDRDGYLLRHRIMAEEVDEYLEACEQGDLTGIADALGDQLYILCGTLLKHGLQHKIEDVFTEIHYSNMSKLDENGQPIYREDGKVMKGPHYFKPDIASILSA